MMKNYNYNKACEQVYIEQDKVLYQWTVNPVKWKESVKPIEAQHNKYIRLFSIIALCGLWIPLFFTSVVFFIRNKDIDSDFIGILIFVLLISIIMLVAGFFVKKILYNNLYNHERYLNFMTNAGIYTGWVYYTQIFKYKICEKEQRISLCLKRNIFSSQAEDTVKFGVWTNFFYTEKDKPPIFQILFQWEKEKQDFCANSFRDQEYLHKYIEGLEKRRVLTQ